MKYAPSENRTITRRLLSARDSKLTQLLAPLLAGASRLFLLSCTRDGQAIRRLSHSHSAIIT